MKKNRGPWDIDGQRLSFKVSTDASDASDAKRVLASFFRTARSVATPTISGVVENMRTGAWYAIVARRRGDNVEATVLERPSKDAAVDARTTTAQVLGISDHQRCGQAVDQFPQPVGAQPVVQRRDRH